MTEKLKPCPFCGGEADILSYDSIRLDSWLYHVYRAECQNCHTTQPSVTSFIEAVRIWNRRQEMIATWETKDEEEYQWECSICHETFDFDYPWSIYSTLRYCPNCGARMLNQNRRITNEN